MVYKCRALRWIICYYVGCLPHYQRLDYFTHKYHSGIFSFITHENLVTFFYLQTHQTICTKHQLTAKIKTLTESTLKMVSCRMMKMSSTQNYFLYTELPSDKTYNKYQLPYNRLSCICAFSTQF